MTERRICPKPCSACPFRRTSWAGWLGSDTPEGFIEKTEAGVAMPCHSAVDYEGKNWKKQAEVAPLCRGALTYLVNNGKRPFVPPEDWPVPAFLRRDIPQVLDALENGGVEKDDEFFQWKHEFIEHHTADPGNPRKD